MLEPGNNDELPPIPGKRYFTIGEVSDLCAVKPHVLRYWEQEFPQLKPVKRRGNRRYYQRQDVLIIRQIRSLLYDEGFTIGGARQRLEPDLHDQRADAARRQRDEPAVHLGADRAAHAGKIAPRRSCAPSKTQAPGGLPPRSQSPSLQALSRLARHVNTSGRSRKGPDIQ